jgi:hypothetical protein
MNAYEKFGRRVFALFEEESSKRRADIVDGLRNIDSHRLKSLILELEHDLVREQLLAPESCIPMPDRRRWVGTNHPWRQPRPKRVL